MTESISSKTFINNSFQSPKFNNADICEHGATQVAFDVLDIVELEKTEDMKYTVRTATADVDIEGANISRSEDEGEIPLFNLFLPG